MSDEEKVPPVQRLSPAQIKRRVEVKRIANRVLANSDTTMEKLADAIDSTRMYIWNLLTSAHRKHEAELSCDDS